MLAIHGLWSKGRGLLLWAEDSGRPVVSPSTARRGARPHPFALPADQLAAIHPGKRTVVTLLLPSTPRAPLDSPELTRAVPRRPSRSAPSLLAWSVPAVLADPSELTDLVDEVRYGASITHLRAVIDFAEDLVVRGRVLPGVRTDAGLGADLGRARAVWLPVVTGPDAAVRRALIDAMPPVGRSEQAGPSGMATLTGLDGQDPADLVDDALATLADNGVRERLGRAGHPPMLVPPHRGRQPESVVDAWLSALTSADGSFSVDPAGLRVLETALQPWAGIVEGPSGPARATFRLTEAAPLDDPADPDPSLPDTIWRLEFLLGSVADPSLLVPAERIWNSPGGLRRWLDQPQELLLAELARASTVYPQLAEALREPRPTALELDLAGAYHFLSEVAGRLDQAGFGVLLPAWWGSSGRTGRRLSLSVTASATPSEAVVTDGGLSREVLARFDWRLAVGDIELTEEEITELVATKAPLVRLRGQWVTVDPDRLRRGLEFLRSAPTRALTASEALAVLNERNELSGDHRPPLPIASVRADGWLGDLLSGSAEHTLRPVEPPPGFRATLRPYQRRGLSWLSFMSMLGLGACLADDMGLGKTVQLLALEATERGVPKSPTQGVENPDSPNSGATLLVCPTSLVGNWQREAAKFAPQLRVCAYHGAARPRGAKLAALLADADLVITTYGTVSRDIDELAEMSFRRVVLDEAQLVKNSRSASAQAVRRLRAGHRIALTGTPMENRLAELWSVLDFLNPGVLGSRESFRRRFAVPIERHSDTEAAGRLRRITRPYLLRRRKTDRDIADDLPDKIEIIQDYRLTSEQASLYRTVVDDMLEKIAGSEGIQRRGAVLAAMAKLKQVCNHPAQLLHDGSPIGRRSGKVTRLEEVLAELLAEGDRALLFTQFTEFAELLVPHLSARFDQEVLYLHGGTPRKRRDELVRRFQSPDGPQIFLLSVKAGGTGLNLTAANHVLHLDRWWNPAVENQATDRAFRIGQRRTVQVRKFVCAGTLEERIDQLIAGKRELADLVISDGEGWLAELSTQRLRELFLLDEAAVEE